MPPRIQIDLDSTTPINRQIVDQLRLQLVEGGIRPGDTLPSVRRLSIDLGIHFNTVADAYRSLAEEGWLDVSQGRPVRVRERAMPPASPETREMFLRRLRQLVAEARAGGVPAASLTRDLQAILETLK